MFKRLVLAVAVLGLSGCAGVNIDNFRDAGVKGTAFTQELVKEYKSFVKSEAAQYDWPDADHFAQKGLQALNGENVMPENPSDWNLPDHNFAEIENYYYRLDYILANGAKKSSPTLAARAMAKYDCWVEQQEENHQPAHIAECRNEFMTAFAALERAEPSLAAKAKDAAKSRRTSAPTAQSANGKIYFDFNSAALTPDDTKELKSIAKQAGKKSKVTVSGFTDTAGSDAYNRALSHRRAMAVRRVLVESGVPAKNIRIQARGESDLAIPTGDGMREGKNRRATVTID